MKFTAIYLVANEQEFEIEANSIEEAKQIAQDMPDSRIIAKFCDEVNQKDLSHAQVKPYCVEPIDNSCYPLFF